MFLMAPSSENESNSMKNIIKKLRMYSSPELSQAANGLFFNAPAQWAIKFYHNGQENTNIPKIRQCVLSDISVNFTPAGEWSTFKNGHPVSAVLHLKFIEMEIIHSKLVDEGY